ncbi:cytochrome c [Thalassovita sp.]|uniref:c-type cytochrome n=1 Tax=Thalassovita sp. TaxID=1979401 RepID=UPI0029DE5F7C|nr:cytochrome c [Thalassovita sp.]
MKITITLLSGAAIALGLAASALAESHVDKAISDAVTARQSTMKLYAFNLGLLGNMAKGAIPYDADAASKAAGNLAALSRMDQSRMWPAGSDDMSIDNTRALPALWDNMNDVMAKGADAGKAIAAMETAAGAGLESLQAAMGPLGGACGACHKAYRAPEK